MALAGVAYFSLTPCSRMEAKMHWFGTKITCHEGFTLGEVVVAVGLFGILAAIALPNFTSAMLWLRLADVASYVITGTTNRQITNTPVPAVTTKKLLAWREVF